MSGRIRMSSLIANLYWVNIKINIFDTFLKSADASKLLQSFIANFRATVSKISVISDKTVVANNATLAKVSLYPYVIC